MGVEDGLRIQPFLPSQPEAVVLQEALPERAVRRSIGQERSRSMLDSRRSIANGLRM